MPNELDLKIVKLKTKKMVVYDRQSGNNKSVMNDINRKTIRNMNNQN